MPRLGHVDGPSTAQSAGKKENVIISQPFDRQPSESQPNTLVRAVSDSDVPAIADFQTTCWREAYRGVVPQEYLDRVGVEDRERRWGDRLASGTRRIALAEIGSDIVGVVSWGLADVDDAPALELMSLYVAADQRGTGLAVTLTHRAVAGSPAHLWVFEDNPRAKRFYGKRGFRFDGHRRLDPDTGLWEQRFVRR
jgi:GNAT superfamily N-acetyltransferase